MIRNKILNQNNEKGFTLIELMVVVLIIGILVAVAIPVFGNAANNARLKSDRANLRTIDGAIAQYWSEETKNPGSIQDLVTAKYLKALPKSPYTGATSDYSLTAADANGNVSAQNTVSLNTY